MVDHIVTAQCRFDSKTESAGWDLAIDNKAWIASITPSIRRLNARTVTIAESSYAKAPVVGPNKVTTITIVVNLVDEYIGDVQDFVHSVESALGDNAAHDLYFTNDINASTVTWVRKYPACRLDRITPSPSTKGRAKITLVLTSEGASVANP